MATTLAEYASTIRKPGERLERRTGGSLMDVEIYETFVVKRPARAVPGGPLPQWARDAARRQQAARDVPGVLRCELTEDAIIEERAPGEPLGELIPPLSGRELRYVYRQTAATAAALRTHGIRLNRHNPKNTFLERKTGRVTQIDLHHPVYPGWQPEDLEAAALRVRFRRTLACAVSEQVYRAALAAVFEDPGRQGEVEAHLRAWGILRETGLGEGPTDLTTDPDMVSPCSRRFRPAVAAVLEGGDAPWWPPG